MFIYIDDTLIKIILFSKKKKKKEIAASLTLPDPDKKLAELDMMLTNKQYEALYGNKTGNRYTYFVIKFYKM